MTATPTLRTVMVVDDEAEVRESISEYLRTEGFEVVEAANGLEALVQVKRIRPAAVILDLMMPRLGGLDALKRIRAFDAGITVVVVTGTRDEELQRQALSLGAGAFLTKPFAMDALLAAVDGSKAPPAGSRRAEAAVSASPIVPGRSPAATGKRILIVDDEPEICAILEEFLTENGYRTRSASDGAMAVRAVVGETPDIVLLDLNMPRLGGIEALTAIRAIAPGVKVIMISGQADVDLARRSLAYGAFDYITKPFDMGYLARSVETALLVNSLDTEPGG